MKFIKILWLVTLGLIIFGFAGIGTYFYLSEKNNFALQNGPIINLDFPTNNPIKLVKNNTADWKTYTSGELGISLKYPPEWKNFSLKGRDKGDLGISQISNPFDKTGKPIFFDKENLFYFNAFKESAYRQEEMMFNLKPVNPDWTKEQFASQMDLPLERIEFVKKFGIKSLLVSYREDNKCLPRVRLVVLTPLAGNYPNLEIRFAGLSEQDPDFLAFNSSSSTTENSFNCAFFGASTAIEKAIKDGSYQQKIDSFINLANNIADSVTILED